LGREKTGREKMRREKREDGEREERRWGERREKRENGILLVVISFQCMNACYNYIQHFFNFIQ
jgi:hypothetical protein